MAAALFRRIDCFTPSCPALSERFVANRRSTPAPGILLCLLAPPAPGDSLLCFLAAGPVRAASGIGGGSGLSVSWSALSGASSMLELIC
tara:strand:- start:103 stop:369 length:267 start_codon:yes stop_codon:yes gene_type:complete